MRILSRKAAEIHSIVFDWEGIEIKPKPETDSGGSYIFRVNIIL